MDFKVNILLAVWASRMLGQERGRSRLHCPGPY